MGQPRPHLPHQSRSDATSQSRLRTRLPGKTQKIEKSSTEDLTEDVSLCLDGGTAENKSRPKRKVLTL